MTNHEVATERTALVDRVKRVKKSTVARVAATALTVGVAGGCVPQAQDTAPTPSSTRRASTTTESSIPRAPKEREPSPHEAKVKETHQMLTRVIEPLTRQVPPFADHETTIGKPDAKSGIMYYQFLGSGDEQVLKWAIERPEKNGQNTIRVAWDQDRISGAIGDIWVDEIISTGNARQAKGEIGASVRISTQAFLLPDENNLCDGLGVDVDVTVGECLTPSTRFDATGEAKDGTPFSTTNGIRSYSTPSSSDDPAWAAQTGYETAAFLVAEIGE